jgi:hypothetical protein
MPGRGQQGHGTFEFAFWQFCPFAAHVLKHNLVFFVVFVAIVIVVVVRVLEGETSLHKQRAGHRDWLPTKALCVVLILSCM